MLWPVAERTQASHCRISRACCVPLLLCTRASGQRASALHPVTARVPVFRDRDRATPRDVPREPLLRCAAARPCLAPPPDQEVAISRGENRRAAKLGGCRN